MTDHSGFNALSTIRLKRGTDIASAAELQLGTGNIFKITGTTNITSIRATDTTDGRLIILIFADVLTFTDGNNLVLSGNFITSANDTITLISDGTNWYEISRSTN